MIVRKIKKITTNETYLSFFQNIKKYISVKRVFFVFAKKKCLRGNHAHKKCSQLLVSVSGNYYVEIFDGKKTKKVLLKELKNFIYVPPLHWVKVFFKKKNKLMVFCNQNFKQKDYINKISEFKKFLNKKR